MSQLTLPELAVKMKHIDFTMMSTHTENGEIAARPMSNNGDVEYDGDSFYFAWKDSRVVQDIQRDSKVSLSFQGKPGLLGKPPVMVAVEGQGQLIEDKVEFRKHWNKDLERWFEQGVETPGLMMIKVHARRVHYWDGEAQGEISV